MRRLLALVLALASPATAAQLYIAPWGDDADPGTRAAPRLTIDGAVNDAAFASGDTLWVVTADTSYTWSGATTFTPEPAKSGTAGEKSWIVAHPDNPRRPRFVSAADDTPFIDVSSTDGNLRQQWGVIGPMDLIAYGDTTTVQAESAGIIRIVNATTSTTTTGYWIEHLYAGSPGDSTMTLVHGAGAPSDSTSATSAAIDSLVVLSCELRDGGADGIRLHRVRNAVIEGTRLIGTRGGPGDGILVTGHDNSAAPWIAYVTIDGWDDGIEVVGGGNGIWWGAILETDITRCSGRLIAMADDATYRTQGWLIGENTLTYGGAGIELQGRAHRVYSTTVYEVAEELLRFAGAAPESIIVEGSIFAESKSGDALTLATGHAGLTIARNVWHDRGGALTVTDADDGGVTTIAAVNAEAYGQGNVEASPQLADTTGAVNLGPLRTSPAAGLGAGGRRFGGAEPCADCVRDVITISGSDAADSAHYEWRDRLGELTAWQRWGSLYEIQPGRAYLATYAADSLLGRVSGRGSAFFDAAPESVPGSYQSIDILPPATFAAKVSEVEASDHAATQTAVAGVSTQVTGVQAQVAGVASDVGNIASDISAIPANVRDISNTALGSTTLGGQLRTISQDLASGGITIDDAALEAAIEAARDSTIDSLGTGIASIEASVDTSEIGTAVDWRTRAALGDSLAVTEAAIIARGDEAWTTGIGGGGGGSIGDGAFDHVIGVRSTADSSTVMGARVLMRLESDQTLFVDASTKTSGFVSTLLDSDTTYRLRVFENGAYNPLSPDSLFTIVGGGDTTTVYLDPLGVSLPDDPVNQVLMTFNTVLWTGNVGAIDSVLVEVRPKCQGCIIGGAFSTREWVTMGWTNAAGQLTFPLQRSSTIVGAGSDVSRRQYEVKTTDLRPEGSRVWTSRTLDNVTAPDDSVTANVRWNSQQPGGN